MKVFCMHIKIFLCIISLAILLGIVTVTPCAAGQKHSVLNRSYSVDTHRAEELTDKAKCFICKLCKKKQD